VTDMSGMFMEAESFDQNICSWLPNPIAYADASGTMFSGSVAFCASAPNNFAPWVGGSDGTNTWSKTNLGGHWC